MALAELLDPQGSLFGGRLIATGEPSAPDEAASTARLLQVGARGREPLGDWLITRTDAVLL